MDARFHRQLFGLIVVAFVLQLGFRIAFGEPYPGLFMPDFFGTGGNREGSITQPILRFEVGFDGEPVQTYEFAQVFDHVQTSNHGKLTENFALEETGRPPVAYAVSPRWFPSYASRVHWSHDRGKQDQIGAWLAGRIRDLAPERAGLTTIDAVWTVATYVSASGQVSVSERPQGRIRFFDAQARQ